MKFHCTFTVVSQPIARVVKSNVNGIQFSVVILILIEDKLMLSMFYLENRRIVACNMLVNLIDF